MARKFRTIAEKVKVYNNLEQIVRSAGTAGIAQVDLMRAVAGGRIEHQDYALVTQLLKAGTIVNASGTRQGKILVHRDAAAIEARRLDPAPYSPPPVPTTPPKPPEDFRVHINPVDESVTVTVKGLRVTVSVGQ